MIPSSNSYFLTISITSIFKYNIIVAKTIYNTIINLVRVFNNSPQLRQTSIKVARPSLEKRATQTFYSCTKHSSHGETRLHPTKSASSIEVRRSRTMERDSILHGARTDLLTSVKISLASRRVVDSSLGPWIDRRCINVSLLISDPKISRPRK